MRTNSIYHFRMHIVIILASFGSPLPYDLAVVTSWHMVKHQSSGTESLTRGTMEEVSCETGAGGLVVRIETLVRLVHWIAAVDEHQNSMVKGRKICVDHGVALY